MLDMVMLLETARFGEIRAVGRTSNHTDSMLFMKVVARAVEPEIHRVGL
jgi:hypothetical protein